MESGLVNMRVRYVSEPVALQLVPDPQSALVSITEPGREAPLPNPDSWGALLRVQFADAEYDNDMLTRLEARGVPFDPDAKGFPCRRHAEAIRAFLAGLDVGRMQELIVHCHAGQRRSAAVAKYAAETLEAEGFNHGYEGYNKTVYALLANPATFAPIAQARGLKGWLKRLWRPDGQA